MPQSASTLCFFFQLAQMTVGEQKTTKWLGQSSRHNRDLHTAGEVLVGIDILCWSTKHTLCACVATKATADVKSVFKLSEIITTHRHLTTGGIAAVAPCQLFDRSVEPRACSSSVCLDGLQFDPTVARSLSHRSPGSPLFSPSLSIARVHYSRHTKQSHM